MIKVDHFNFSCILTFTYRDVNPYFSVHNNFEGTAIRMALGPTFTQYGTETVLRPHEQNTFALHSWSHVYYTQQFTLGCVI
jgi:hypothetical protein